MTENIFYDKLNLLAWKTEGIFLSSALLENSQESSSFSKFYKKYPEMFSVLFNRRAKIFRARQSFFQFFGTSTQPKSFKTQQEILTELLHSSFLLDNHFQSQRNEKEIISKGVRYELDDFSENNFANVITFEPRQYAFNSRLTKVHVPSHLKSKWSRHCLQNYMMGKQFAMKDEGNIISPERAKALMDEVSEL
jgi:hypothetical protein